MQSFEDYRKELTMPQLLVSANCCRHAFEAGQQSKQAEVDELQKRVDKAIYDLQHIESVMWEEQVEHVLMVLKGDQS